MKLQQEMQFKRNKETQVVLVKIDLKKKQFLSSEHFSTKVTCAFLLI